VNPLSNLVSLSQFDFDCGDVSGLALFSKYFSSYIDFFDWEFSIEEASSADLYYVDSFWDDATSCLHWEFLSATIDLHNDGSGVAHKWLLTDQYGIGRDVTPGRGSLLHVFCQALFTSEWKVYTGGVARGSRARWIDKRLSVHFDLWEMRYVRHYRIRIDPGRVQFSLNNVVIFPFAASIS